MLPPGTPKVHQKHLVMLHPSWFRMNKRLELREKNLKQQPEAEKGHGFCVCVFIGGRVVREENR